MHYYVSGATLRTSFPGCRWAHLSNVQTSNWPLYMLQTGGRLSGYTSVRGRSPMASAEAKRIKAVLARANSTSTLKSAVTPPSAFGGSSRQDAESIFSGNPSRHGSIQSNRLSAGGQTQHSLRKTAWENNSMTRPASTGGNLQSSSKSLGGNVGTPDLRTQRSHQSTLMDIHVFRIYQTAASDRSGKSGQQQQSTAARLRAMLVDKVQAKYPGSIRAGEEGVAVMVGSGS